VIGGVLGALEQAARNAKVRAATMIGMGLRMDSPLGFQDWTRAVTHGGVTVSVIN
jgi:hypothetical protein